MNEKRTVRDTLRREAEARLVSASQPLASSRSAEELLHELQVHHIELKMQNDKLRKAQVIIEESRDRYVDLYDFAPIGYLTLNRDALIAEVNLNRRFARLVAPEDHDRWHRQFVSVLQHGDRQSCELALQRVDGSRFYAQLDYLHKKVRDTSSVRIAFTDISARRQAEEKLFKANALQNAIFNSENFSSIATDAKGVIQIFNVGAERMLGYTALEVVNKVTPDDLSDPQEVVERAKTLSSEFGMPINPGFEALAFKASRGIEDIYELTKIRRDGSRFPAVVSVTALRDAQHAIIGYLLIGTDNTARKQIETERALLDQRLHEQQFYTRSLIESNIDAIITTDLSGFITDVNQQMVALTGRMRHELIGGPFKDYFTDPERAEAAINMVLSEKKVTNYELTARAMDGKETVVSYSAATFYDRNRKLQGVFAAARDVTERKRLDQELESAKLAAEKANLAKSDFLSSMRHELRTPLNSILGFAQLLEASTPPPTSTQIERLRQIIKAGWYLLTLINEVLDLSVIESGKVTLSRDPVLLIYC